MKRQQHPPSAAAGVGKAKLWEQEEESRGGGGMDELLAVLGYKVKSTDMADVAYELEQLEMAMGAAPDDGISSLSSDTVHFNPSDLSSWVHTMLSELNSPTSAAAHSTSSVNRYDQDRYDLGAIPGDAVCSDRNNPKRMRIGPPGESNFRRLSPAAYKCVDAPRPVLVVSDDARETAGVRLVHALLACAEAVEGNNLKLADALLKHIGVLAAAQAGAMRKVSAYFAEALARKIYGIFPDEPPIGGGGGCSYEEMLEMHFYEACPYLKFAHFTANQAILEALGGAERVHVVDFGLKQGMQWPVLMQALALRPGGPPAFRLTGIGRAEALEEVGWKLGEMARTVGVAFEFKAVALGRLADLEAAALDVREGEAVAVNAVFELHRLLAEPAAAVERVLAAVRGLRPRVVAVVEQEADHNRAGFLDRFTEALYYYSTMFDSLEGGACVGGGRSEDLVPSEMHLGRQICDVVAGEGAERVERHEPLARWRARMEGAGFEGLSLGSNAFKQASVLLGMFAGGEGYRVEERDGCLTLGWHTRPLIATSAWKPAAAAVSRK